MLLVDRMPRFPVPTARQRLARAVALRRQITSRQSNVELEIQTCARLREEIRSSQAEYLDRLEELDTIAIGVALKLIRAASGRYANGMEAHASRGIPVQKPDPELLAHFVARVKQMATDMLNLDVRPRVWLEQGRLHLTIVSL